MKRGDYKTRLYHIWAAMLQRCNNPNSINYNNYGGRGIKVCGEWRNFAGFQEWALAHGYEENLSIDRIDYNGNYEPQNCRWATRLEQANNQRSNLKLLFNGEVHTPTEISKLTGISINTIYGTHNKYGVVDFTNFKPRRAKHRNIKFVKTLYIVYSCGKNLGYFKTLEEAIDFRNKRLGVFD